MNAIQVAIEHYETFGELCGTIRLLDDSVNRATDAIKGFNEAAVQFDAILGKDIEDISFEGGVSKVLIVPADKFSGYELD